MMKYGNKQHECKPWEKEEKNLSFVQILRLCFENTQTFICVIKYE